MLCPVLFVFISFILILIASLSALEKTYLLPSFGFSGGIERLGNVYGFMRWHFLLSLFQLIHLFHFVFLLFVCLSLFVRQFLTLFFLQFQFAFLPTNQVLEILVFDLEKYLCCCLTLFYEYKLNIEINRF